MGIRNALVSSSLLALLGAPALATPSAPSLGLRPAAAEGRTTSEPRALAARGKGKTRSKPATNEATSADPMAQPTSVPDAAAAPPAEDNPLLPQSKSDEERQAAATAAAAAASEAQLWRHPGTWWVGFGFGVGRGWHGKRALDVRGEPGPGGVPPGGLEADAGFLSAGSFHLLPEVGYQWTERTAISVQTRHQKLPDEGFGDARPGPPKWSHLLLVHATHNFTEGRLQLFGSGTAGAGSGFRLVVPPNGGNLVRTDTIRGGPVVLGPGAGVSYFVWKSLSAVAEARVLAGLPDFAIVGELNLGAQYGF